MTRTLSLAVATALAAGSACADPGYYVITPYDREGLLGAEARYWTVKPHHGSEVTWPEVGFSYGVNSRWTTLLLQSYIGSSQDATVPSSLSWQNEILLTQGDYPFDLALHLALIRLQGDEPGDAYEFGAIGQTEIGPTQINANLVFERERSAGAWGATKLKYQWQLRRHGHPWVQAGIQGFGELGTWNDWSPRERQSHRIGPALFITFPPGGQRALQAQAAYLFGSTYGRAGHMFSARLLFPF